MMSQRENQKSGISVKDLDHADACQCANLEEPTRCLEQELIQKEEMISQLTQMVGELEARTVELSAGWEQALAESQEWTQTESALRQKTEALAKSNQELDQFASLAAHDLQEPLHSIQVFLDLLRVKHGSSLNEQGCSYLNRVTTAANRMQELIEGLLLYSRIDAPESQGLSLSLGKIVQDILSDFEAQIAELQAEIHVGELPEIHGDALQMRQLLQNLISNALKFHKPGCVPVLQISSREIQDRRHTGLGRPDRLCQIEVEDQGIGIPVERLDEIFGMFKRLHRKDEFGGAGIGLAVCRRIADQCRGTISVHSTLGEGATFTVTLPVQRDF